MPRNAEQHPLPTSPRIHIVYTNSKSITEADVSMCLSFENELKLL